MDLFILKLKEIGGGGDQFLFSRRPSFRSRFSFR